MAYTSAELLTSLLRDVSRSFYLTLRVLPAGVRPQIGLAYLLARTTDTIADTGLVPVDLRLAALASLRGRILGRSSSPLSFGDLARHQGSGAEKVLLEQCEVSLGLLQSLSPQDLEHVRRVLDIITSGQELDLRRFASASAEQVISLSSEAEWDDYTYRVAGCVGEFWTRMCREHLFPSADLDEPALLANGIRFGKGLQCVNILRDLPVDLRQGRCYLPADGLERLGLRPADLLDPGSEPRVRPLYDHLLDLAQGHLRAGWLYTNTLPWKCARVRLACAWPILIAARTLDLLRTQKVLDSSQRIKVPRRTVKFLMLQSLAAYPFPPVWRRLHPGREAAPPAC
jgi:farnesyl-diphosphate farnesyltransferase